MPGAALGSPPQAMPERGDPPDALPGDRPADELRAARPAVDRLGMEAARERAQRALFGTAAPARLGRYVLLGPSGDGGMGIVYAAYDPELQRKVALKVLHPRRRQDDRAHERLIAEAQTLARLDHPNVVRVHDVITQSDQVVIVMEWVDGITLASWERERPRSWREVVTVYAQAAQGLAAAHGVGVVHRDFKPTNAIVGRDGRVRVLDFGLARSTAPADEPPLAAGSRDVAPAGDGDAATSLTATGAVVGTLAYAAPEQLDGNSVTAASDQFSFAVAMHRALEGVAPFEGNDAEARSRSIRSGRIAIAATRAVPSWLRSIVVRALADEPAARFRSMSALLAELRRPRGWRRWRIPVIVGGCFAIAAIAVIVGPWLRDPLAGCDGGAAEVAAVWNPVLHARIDAALRGAVTTRDAAEIRGRVLHSLDDYRERWVGLHRDACVASRRGAQSADLLDRRIACLQRRLGDLPAAVESLRAEVAPPPDAARRAVADVRREISQAIALDHAGRSREALAAATAALQDAERSGYPPIVADAALTQGRILLARRDNKPAIAALGRARSVALEHARFAIAVEAAARKLYVEGIEGAELSALQRDAEVFLPLSKALPGDHFAGPLLLNNLGVVALAASDRGEARRYFQQASAALADVPAPDLELAVIDRNLALLTSDAAVRESLVRGVWQRLRGELGDSHLETIEALEARGWYIRAPARALPLVADACTAYATFHPEMIPQRVHCESYRAFLTGELGDHAEELRRYEDIAGIAAGTTNPDTAVLATLASGYARLLRDDPGGAIAQLQPIARRDAPSPDWWVSVRAAHAELGIGLAELALGHDAEATRHLDRALAGYEEAIPVNEEAEYRLRAARTRRALAAIPHSGNLRK
ncbi:MAG: serine/threonine protein kinase [Deltaproteobacteria bacterium]|nr:MAG: serine/threonine protein kinase [Deltaproteobacteria bacterium]